MVLRKWLSGKQPFVTIKCRQVNFRLMEGDRGRGRPRENGAGNVSKAGDEGGRKRNSQGGGKQERKAKIIQQCTIISQSKTRAEAGAKKYRVGTGCKEDGKREFQSPCPPSD